jgi:Fe-S-cluster containining protein
MKFDQKAKSRTTRNASGQECDECGASCCGSDRPRLIETQRKDTQDRTVVKNFEIGRCKSLLFECNVECVRMKENPKYEVIMRQQKTQQVMVAERV